MPVLGGGASASSPRPSLAELKAVAQPDEVIGRVSSEHWAGRLYMRKVSPYLTLALLPTRITANGVTWLMIVCGLLAAVALSIPGLLWAFLAALGIQLQLLFDCSDGEIARWRRTTGPQGVYLDRIGHYYTEAALLMAMGVRADGGLDGGLGTLGGWTMLGLLGATFVLMRKAETDLVHVARAIAGMPRMPDTAEVMAPRRSGLRRLRELARFVPFFRALNALELTVLALVAAVVDVAIGSAQATQILTVALVAIGAVIMAAHLLSVLSSGRLR